MISAAATDTKKHATGHLLITSAIVARFSEFCHCWTQW